MIAHHKDQVAMREALRRVSALASDLETLRDTDAVKRAAQKVWGAAIDAYELAKAIEDNTRNHAQRELEAALEQRVGMEREPAL